MLRTIFIFLKSLTLFLLFITNLYAEELTIIPIKKPVLDKITKQQKIEQGIIRPKSKPNLKIKDIKISNDIIIPETKPNNKDEIIHKISKLKEEHNKEKLIVLDIYNLRLKLDYDFLFKKFDYYLNNIIIE